MSLTDKKVAVLVGPGFEDSELLQPVDTLRNAGVGVTLIGLSQDDKRGVKGKRGAVVPVDAAIDEVREDDFDALLIPGGKGPAHLRRDPRVLEFARAFDRDRKTIAAICHGPQVLASADLLKGRTTTSFFTVIPEVRKAGALYVNRPVVIDRNLITSRKPGDIPQFSQAILEALDALPARERKIA